MADREQAFYIEYNDIQDVIIAKDEAEAIAEFRIEHEISPFDDCLSLEIRPLYPVE